MSIAGVVLRGYSNGTVTGSIAEVVTRGYIAGEPVDPPEVVVAKIDKGATGTGGLEAKRFWDRKRNAEDEMIMSCIEQFLRDIQL